MTKVDLITGFLGAGKTTFIKKYSDFLTRQGERVHIIENEFGGLPIDARTLQEADCNVSQLPGGCMCCTGREAFQQLLVAAAEAGFTRILVEPSGIYDVSTFFSLVETSPVKEVCQIGSIITVADACPETNLSPQARFLLFSQLIYSGCVVLSKTQLHTPAQVQAARAELQQILREHGSSRDLDAEGICVTTPWDCLTPQALQRISACGYRMMEHTYEVMDHMTLFSTMMLGGRFDTLPHLEAILHELVDTQKYGRVYRIKGYISSLDGSWYEISCSPSGCFIQESSVRRGLFLVIGQDYDEAAIRQLFLPRR